MATVSTCESTHEMGTLSRGKRYALSKTLLGQVGDVLVAHGTLKFKSYYVLLSRIVELIAEGTGFDTVLLSGDSGLIDQRDPGLSSSENCIDVPEDEQIDLASETGAKGSHSDIVPQSADSNPLDQRDPGLSNSESFADEPGEEQIDLVSEPGLSIPDQLGVVTSEDSVPSAAENPKPADDVINIFIGQQYEDQPQMVDNGVQVLDVNMKARKHVTFSELLRDIKSPLMQKPMGRPSEHGMTVIGLSRHRKNKSHRSKAPPSNGKSLK